MTEKYMAYKKLSKLSPAGNERIDLTKVV